LGGKAGQCLLTFHCSVANHYDRTFPWRLQDGEIQEQEKKDATQTAHQIEPAQVQTEGIDIRPVGNDTIGLTPISVRA